MIDNLGIYTMVKWRSTLNDFESITKIFKFYFYFHFDGGYNRKAWFESFPVDESMTCCPDEAYSLSKQLGEQLADGLS